MSHENQTNTTNTTETTVAAVPATADQPKGFFKRNAKKFLYGVTGVAATTALAVGGWVLYTRQQNA